MSMASLMLRCTLPSALLVLLVGCPDPYPRPSPAATEIHLLDLDRHTMVKIQKGENQTFTTGSSALQPSVGLVAPKAVMAFPWGNNPYSPRLFFLESPAGVPSYSSYTYGGRPLRLFDSTSRVTGPLPHPGGSVAWTFADAGLGFSFLAWGTETPFLMGYQADVEGKLTVWPYLPELPSAPVGLALRNDLLCVGAASGGVSVYQLQNGAPPVSLAGLSEVAGLQALSATAEGLFLLRRDPASLDLYRLDASGIGERLSTIPVTGTPYSLEVQPRGGILVTSLDPQAVTLFGIEGSALKQLDILVAIRGDFAVLKATGGNAYPDARLLLDGTRGQACWVTTDFQNIDLGHLAVPTGNYAPAQIGPFQ